MAKTNLGRIVPMPVGVWDNTTPYKMLDVVRSGNTVFWAKRDNENTPTSNADIWFPLGVFGEDGYTPVIEVGIITTGAPGSEASVELEPNGTTEDGNPKFLLNMTIPKGAPGDGAGNVVVEESLLVAGRMYLFVPAADGSAVGEFIEYTPPEQVQTDWEQSDSEAADYLKNKPSVPTKTSDIENDSDYQTESDVDAKIGSHNASGSAHTDIRENISTLQSGVDGINEKIPSAASPDNQLADQEFVNSSISNMAANYVTLDADGNAFATKAALLDASVFYHDGEVYQPTNKDYVTVLSDESHDGECWRYTYTGTIWSAQYRVNEAPMTQAQLNALNSGISAEKVASYDNLLTYPKHKSVTLLPSNWTLFEDTGLYRVLIEDAAVVDGVTINGGVDATDTESYAAWKAASGVSGVFDTTTVGQFYVYAEKLPTANINFKYTISL